MEDMKITYEVKMETLVVDSSVIVNIDTTGLPSKSNPPDIIQISVMDLRGNVLFSATVDSDKEITEEAKNTNHIPTGVGIKWDFVLPFINTLVKDKMVIFWNARFDLPILTRHGVRVEEYIDLQLFFGARTPIGKPEFSKVKGCQTIGKCSAILTKIIDYTKLFAL